MVMGKIINAYKSLVGKAKRQLGKYSRRLADNIKMTSGKDFKSMSYIQLGQYRFQ
jgi:hypothetical protein